MLKGIRDIIIILAGLSVLWLVFGVIPKISKVGVAERNRPVRIERMEEKTEEARDRENWERLQRLSDRNRKWDNESKGR